MFFPPAPKNPLNPNDYIVWETVGHRFIQKHLGLFGYWCWEEVKKPVDFLGEEFINDNAKLGIQVNVDKNGEIYGILSSSLVVKADEAVK